MREWTELWYSEPMEGDQEVSKKLTGRWKIKDGTIYLEVKRFFFREWLAEYYLEFEAHTETIFDCNA